MTSTRLESGSGHGKAGLRISIGALSIVGFIAMLFLSVPGSAEPFSVQAQGQNAHGLARTASQSQSAEPIGVAALAICGSLSFVQAVNYTVGTLPFSVAAANLNGDSLLDLATANYNSNNASVLLGNSN